MTREARNLARRAGVWAAALLLVAFTGVALGAAEEAVKVEKGEVAVEYKRFDPAKLPDPPPPLEAGEAAVCVYRFGVELDSGYAFEPPAARDAAAADAGRPVKVAVTVERVSVKLNLSVTVWLPTAAGKALVEHEEGHRQIAERFYADAERAARAAAGRAVGTKVEGSGKDARAAGRAAIERVNQTVCDEYLSAVSEPCERAQAAFDRLTDHGRKASPAAKEGVEVAVKEGREKR